MSATAIVAAILACGVALAGEPAPTSPTVARGYQLFPVRGVFFPAESSAHIDPDFNAAIAGGQQGYFEDAFRDRFPSAAKSITEGTQRRTFAVSLQIGRASKYAVPKPGGTVDLLLPVTASVYFTNVLTGEVLFTSTRTTVQPARVSADDAATGSAKLRELYLNAFRSVVDDLVGDAGERFRPSVVEAKVQKEWNGLAILAGGKDQRIGRDDVLIDAAGNELRVISASSAYAIAQPQLGTFAPGTTFSRVSSRTLAEIRKQRVLPLVEGSPEGMPEEMVLQVFSDALGASAPVSLVPVNRTFAAVLRAVSAQIDLSKEKLTHRELPAYFVRLHVPEPTSFERPTNLAYKTVRLTDAIAYAEVVDRSGRVVFAAVGRDRIEDEITSGMDVDARARKEVAVKNALLALARKFDALKFESATVAITQGGTSLRAGDEHGVLAPGTTLRVYHSIGELGDLGEVRVPTWEVSVTATSADGAELSTTLPIVAGVPAPEKGDVLILDAAGPGLARRNRLGPCGGNEQLGSVALPGYGDLALNLFAAASRAPFYVGGLSERVGALVHGGTGFKEDLRVADPAVDLCVQPVHKITRGESKCSGEACADVVQVAVGYRLLMGGRDGSVKASNARTLPLTAAALPVSTPAEARERSLRADLMEQVIRLAPEATVGLVKQL